ncbi:alkaline phosphatase family protein [Domibacillus indicus]|uniref:alkaline phosphatase family protein n=1 Tax=Domibacillus indicus TaxID=1437523 RepID=UPI00061828B5|nr:alkaline phosphatase family protein [Domibacillus indicus]
MKKLLLPAAGLFLGLSLFSGQAGAESQPEDQDVMVISFDGMRQDITKQYIKTGELPSLEALVEKGVWAKKPETITPSLTAPSHAAMSTGAAPGKTGIVSNQFHDPQKKFSNKDDAFHTTISVPPIWSEAKRQGKTTATVAFPGANPETKNQAADYSVFYGDARAKSSLDQLSFQKAAGWLHAPESFTPLKEAVLPLKLKGAKNRVLHILAVDTTDDHKPNYDQFIVSENKQVNKGDGTAKSNEWGTVSLDLGSEEQAGFAFKIKQERNDLTEPVPFFKTSVTSGLINGPAGFKQDIADRFGFFPVESEDEAFEKKWITRKEYEEISARFIQWTTDVSLYIKQNYKPDVLFFYAPEIDHEAHHYTLTDPRQPGYTKEKADLYESYVKWAYRQADDTIGKTMKAMDENDHLFIVSDHGMEAAHTMLEPNAVLKEAGLLAVDRDGEIDYSKTKAYAVPSGSAAHVYINARSKEKNGIVADDEIELVRKQTMNAFKQAEVKQKNQSELLEQALEAALSGKEDQLLSRLPEKNIKDVWRAGINRTIHPYETVLSSSEAKSLNHTHSGDILLIGAPGYMMANGTGRVSRPSSELGTHGGDSTKQDLRPVFIAAGPSFKEGKTIEETSTLDLAPTVYELLGIKAPSFVEGQIKKDLWKEQ